VHKTVSRDYVKYTALPYHTVTRWVQIFRESGMQFRTSYTLLIITEFSSVLPCLMLIVDGQRVTYPRR